MFSERCLVNSHLVYIMCPIIMKLGWVICRVIFWQREVNPEFILSSSVWSVLPSFPWTAHTPPLHTNTPLLQHYLVHGKSTSRWTPGVSVMCSSLYCTVCSNNGETDRQKEREIPSSLCLCWQQANHLLCRAVAGTNLLKDICNYCGWKGLSHQWACVRHSFQSWNDKLRWKYLQEPSHTHLFG